MSKQREYYEDYWRRGEMIYGPQLEDKKAFIREANRVLKDDGMLIISVPNAANIYSRLNFTLTGELKDTAEIISSAIADAKNSFC